MFKCPVYLSAEDTRWICGPSVPRNTRLIERSEATIVPGVTAVKLGGHFDGSLVLHWEKKLFIADTFVTVPVSLVRTNTPKLQRLIIPLSVSALQPEPPARHYQLLFHVVYTEHDSVATEGAAEHVEGIGTVRL